MVELECFSGSLHGNFSIDFNGSLLEISRIFREWLISILLHGLIAKWFRFFARNLHSSSALDEKEIRDIEFLILGDAQMVQKFTIGVVKRV